MKIKLLLLGFCSTFVFAQEGDLTLQQVLELSQKPSYEQNNILFQIEKSDQNIAITNQNYYPNLYLDTQLGREQNLVGTKNVAMNDSFAYIVWKNNLYSSADAIKVTSLTDTKHLQELQLQESFQKRKIVAMQYFFNTRLATLNHQYILELLAMEAIYRNRVVDLTDTGRVSDIEILEKESILAKASAENYKAEQSVYIEKQKLTDLLGLDFMGVKKLLKPNLESYFNKELPETDKLLELALKHDTMILKINQRITQVDNEIKAIDDTYDIKLNSTVMYGQEGQKTLHYDDNRFEARVNLQIPLYDGKTNANKIQILHIEKKRLENRLNEYKLQLAQKIESLVLELDYQKRLHKAASTNLDYRNLYLEQARIKYDQDRASDLGDAMALLSLAEYEYEKTKYDYVMAYENLNFLTGVENETK